MSKSRRKKNEVKISTIYEIQIIFVLIDFMPMRKNIGIFTDNDRNWIYVFANTFLFFHN